MSHKTKQAVTGRRSRRADDPRQQQQPAAAAASMSPMIVSNPIFSCEGGFDRLIPADLHCGYGPGSVRDVPDDVPAAAAAGGAVGKPLPLPPSRTGLPGTRGAARPALVMTSHQLQYGWVLRRVPQPDDDPFLAAYVACTKTGGEINAAPVKQQRKTEEKSAGTFRGCGIWNGGRWAAGAKYAGAMSSCKHGRAVTVTAQRQQGGAQAPAAAVQASPDQPRLRLSRPLAVIPARKRALARPAGDERIAD